MDNYFEDYIQKLIKDKNVKKLANLNQQLKNNRDKAISSAIGSICLSIGVFGAYKLFAKDNIDIIVLDLIQAFSITNLFTQTSNALNFNKKYNRTLNWSIKG